MGNLCWWGGGREGCMEGVHHLPLVHSGCRKVGNQVGVFTLF